MFGFTQSYELVKLDLCTRLINGSKLPNQGRSIAQIVDYPSHKHVDQMSRGFLRMERGQ